VAMHNRDISTPLDAKSVQLRRCSRPACSWRGVEFAGASLAFASVAGVGNPRHDRTRVRNPVVHALYRDFAYFEHSRLPSPFLS